MPPLMPLSSPQISTVLHRTPPPVSMEPDLIFEISESFGPLIFWNLTDS
jgi:hypothetical protein